jgi:protein-S-isoprenylcysteine O-methyltransferase Ste14
MDSTIFIIILSAEALTTLAVIASIALPQHRIWPPREQHSWGQFVMPVLFGISAGGIFLLGILDWGSISMPTWAQVLAGGTLWLTGTALGLWAIAVLGIAPTVGNKTFIVNRGPYRYCRNPQYAGFILALMGWTLITSSALTLIASLAAFIPLLLVPLAEEPWLLERYGVVYAEYKRKTPRFIGLLK